MISYEIKLAQTGHAVPIVNGITLHSLYDPVTEAQELISQNATIFQNKRNILVFGLGLGYHLQALILELQKNKDEDYRILVLEPLASIVQDCQRHNPIQDDCVTIIQEEAACDIYHRQDFMDFLLSKPGVIYHHPSFQLHKDYFKKFITYAAPTDLQSIASGLEDASLVDYLSQLNEHQDFNRLMEFIKNKKKAWNQDQDMLLMIYDQI